MEEEDDPEEESNPKSESDIKNGREFRDGLAIAMLSLLSISIFIFIDIGLREILAFNIEAFYSYKMLLLLLFPLPFAYVSSISLKGFQKSVLTSSIAFIFALFETKFLLISLTIFLGCIITSYQSKNIFNGKNQGWTIYKSTSYAILIFGLLAASMFIYSYNYDLQFRDEAQDAIAERANTTFSAFLPGIRDIPEDYTEGLKEIPDKTLTLTKGIVINKMQESEEFDSSIEYQIVIDGFKEARGMIQNQSTNQTENLKKEIKSRSNIDFKSIIKSLLEPSPTINAIMFVLILMMSMLIKFPFGALSALYGKSIFSIRSRLS